jgi:hypothetical protein
MICDVHAHYTPKNFSAFPYSSCPDLIRASTETRTPMPLPVESRVKPGHDDQSWCI